MTASPLDALGPLNPTRAPVLLSQLFGSGQGGRLGTQVRSSDPVVLSPFLGTSQRASVGGVGGTLLTPATTARPLGVARRMGFSDPTSGRRGITGFGPSAEQVAAERGAASSTFGGASGFFPNGQATSSNGALGQGFDVQTGLVIGVALVAALVLFGGRK